MADNPFPGMNPYLEDPARWRGLHTRLLTFFSEQLNRDLPENFVAQVEERTYVVQNDRSIYPDFAVFRQITPPSEPPEAGRTLTRTQTRFKPDPGISVRIEPVEMKERFIEIYEIDNDRQQLVTIIEVLSPANKSTTEGREQYRKKQEEVLHSTVHLLEIDLLRAGQYMVAVPQWRVQEEISDWDYITCLHRGNRKWDYIFWPTTVRERLPLVAVPLKGEYADVTLDLQAGIHRCYEAGAYHRFLRYDRDPIPPLSPEDTSWMKALLKEKGLRV